MAAHNRPARIAEELRQELSSLITRGLKDPRITGLVTVTGAKVSIDLKEATAYVSVHAEGPVREKTMEGLRAAAGYLQREAARNLGLRFTPHLRFVYDESVERGDRIDRLLRQVRSRDPGEQASPGPGGDPGAEEGAKGRGEEG
ncbi:MAG TPA: 30S ribosome-binding factor RbfA [Anaeromyxobacter sp.]|nr:30S ribosome-binding factor RbfA [Anaeromyxobacter sp.]